MYVIVSRLYFVLYVGSFQGMILREGYSAPGRVHTAHDARFRSPVGATTGRLLLRLRSLASSPTSAAIAARIPPAQGVGTCPRAK